MARALLNDGCPNPQRRRFRKLKAMGLCAICGKLPVAEKILCERCRTRRKEREYEDIPKLCIICKELVTNKIFLRCEEHRHLTCKECLERFIPKKGAYNSKYCSRKCKGLLQSRLRGDKARNWQGGKVAERRVIRGRIEYHAWRNAVYIRDNWTCQHCGSRSSAGNAVELHAHHIKLFSQYPELRTDVSNGLTLCKRCHRKVHSKAKSPIERMGL